VILDTETTGLHGSAEIVELAIIDMAGGVLFDRRFCPLGEIDPGALAVHRLSAKKLKHEPPFSSVADQVRDILTGKVCVIYNADFDTRMLRQTYAAHSLDYAWLRTLNTQCAMRIYARSIGANKWAKLEGGTHGALSDCFAVLELVRKMAQEVSS
jgi:DNA polymerase III epsilon subunit-like protein